MADTASFDVTLFLKTKHVFDLKLHEGRSMQNASYNSKRVLDSSLAEDYGVPRYPCCDCVSAGRF